MAKKGLSIPFFGKYNSEGTTVTYTEGKTIGHAIEYSTEIEIGGDNPLYGDNVIIEHDNGSFSGGTLTLNTSELTGPVSKWLLGLSQDTVTVGQTEVTENIFDDDSKPITVGFGIIEEHQIDDVNQYRTVILPKCVPQIPANACTTRGESIDWQTTEITFQIERADDAKHRWQIEAWHASAEAAQAYLQQKLGYTAG